MNNKAQLEDLNLLCIVARNNSFAETARQLGVSKAVISKRIALLEAAVQNGCFTGRHAVSCSPHRARLSTIGHSASSKM